jgi:transcriptional regulator with PAS, ATPase and Fis domain
MEIGAATRRIASDPFDNTGFRTGEFEPGGGPDAAPPVASFGRAVAQSPAMVRVLADLQRLAPSDVTLTLIGETGTGKDVLARAIHDASPRARAPFVVFDCGAVAPNLMESELFGHEKGSFTGAHAEHTGAFERAAAGTLFLDEIGELPLELQPRLLRAIDNRTVRRVGGTRDRRVDARIVAATNRDLAAFVGLKQFRQDLYFRLAAAVIRVPPLRERRDDMPLLVASLLADLGRTSAHLDAEAFEVLCGHGWPGNVRELKNTLSCALAFVDADEPLQARHLRFPDAAPDHSVLDHLPLGGHDLDSVEQATITQTLALTRGNKIRAARMLGISHSTLYEKLKRYR